MPEQINTEMQFPKENDKQILLRPCSALPEKKKFVTRRMCEITCGTLISQENKKNAVLSVARQDKGDKLKARGYFFLPLEAPYV